MNYEQDHSETFYEGRVSQQKLFLQYNYCGREAINTKLRQILNIHTVWRDSAVITKQTSQWDYCLPSVPLQVIRCDTLPLPHSPAARRLTRPTNQSPFHYCRWFSAPFETFGDFLEDLFCKHTQRLRSSTAHHLSPLEMISCHYIISQNQILKSFFFQATPQMGGKKHWHYLRDYFGGFPVSSGH